MPAQPIRLTRAPLALAPAVRLTQPCLIDVPQAPLLPWAVADPPDRGTTPEIPQHVQRIVGRLTAGVIEVLRGRRPADHLSTHAADQVHGLIVRLRRTYRLGDLRLASLHLQQPGDRVLEATVRLCLGQRSRAAALRFQQHPAGWRLTHLELALEPGVTLRAG